MINPAVRDGALRVYFPVPEEKTDSTVCIPTVSFPVWNHSLTSHATLRRNVVSVPVAIEQDVYSAKVVGAQSKKVVTYGGGGGSSIESHAWQHLSVCFKTIADLWGRFQELPSGPSSTIDSFETEAALHLYKMKIYEAAESRRRALDYMYDFLEEAFEQKNLKMIDHMLFLSSEQLVDHSLSVSFLRATSRVRKSLVYWKYYEFKVRESLSGHPDAKKLLKGLA